MHKLPFYYRVPILMAILCIPPIGATQIGWYFFGKEFGLKISYEVQIEPNGLAEAFLIGEKFIKNENVCLILGDNIFYGQGLTQILVEAKSIVELQNKAVVFGYNVPNPKDFGVVNFDDSGNALSIEEKPNKPKSNYAEALYIFIQNR